MSQIARFRAAWATADWHRLVLLVAVLGFTGCIAGSQTAIPSGESAPRPPEIIPASPCDDHPYVELRSKPLGAMTAREYEYFTRKDTECSEFRLRHTGVSGAPFETSPWPRASETGSDSIRVTPHPGAASVLRVMGIVALSVVVTIAVIASGLNNAN